MLTDHCPHHQRRPKPQIPSEKPPTTASIPLTRLEGHEGRMFEHAAFRVEKPLGSIQLRIGPSVGVVVDEPEER